MNKYLITYDLNCPGKNYSSLISKIKAYTNAKVCESAWIIRSNSNSSQIRDSLAQEIDTNDSLFIAQLTGEAAWRNCIDSNDKIKKVLE